MRDLERRAAVHQALGDRHRLAMVDALWLSDRTPSELRVSTGLPSNLLAFHLDVLETAGLVERHRSQGDARRRYVTLRTETFGNLTTESVVEAGSVLEAGSDPVLFVCRHNAARSQLAAALWSATTGQAPLSAGTEPADAVHPMAAHVARAHGLDLSGATPRAYDDLTDAPGLVVSVCDRARETALPFDAPLLHWSVPDPAGGRRADFERAFATIQQRVERLAGAVAA